jgi:hypothetical protein
LTDNLGAHAFCLAERIHRKLCIDEGQPLPVKSHRDAAESMLQLRTLVQSGSAVDRDTRFLLLIAGVFVQRRAALTDNDNECNDLQVTRALLFVLQVLCERSRPTHDGSSSPSLMQTGAQLQSDLALAANLSPTSGVDGEIAANGSNLLVPAALEPPVPAATPAQDVIDKWTRASMRDSFKSEGQWAVALRLTPEAVCRACINQGLEHGQCIGLAKATTMAATFFRCSALTMQYNLLSGKEPKQKHTSFLTLDTADLLESANEGVRAEKLAAVVDAAESELGQQVRSLALVLRAFNSPKLL